MPQPEQSVAVVGGGVIGLSCAIALAQRRITVRLCAAQPTPDPMDAQLYDARTYALSRASIHLLESIQVMPFITRYADFEALEIWDSGGGRIRFDASDMGVDRLGIIVTHRHLQDALWRRIAQLRSIHRDDAQIIATAPSDDGGVVAQLEDGRLWQLSLIIGADGMFSKIRRLMNTRHLVTDYRQLALAYVVQTTAEHHATGWQRFSGDSVLAFLPLAPRVCAIVWSCPKARAHQLASLDASHLMAATRREIEDHFGHLSLLSRVRSFALRGGYVERYAAPGIVLIGDAAHQVHPLAGQGANLGFADLSVLLELLDSSRSGRLSYPLLRRYERTVKGYNLGMKVGLESLLCLFSNQSSPVSSLRSVGLRLVDRTPAIKNFFMHWAGSGR